jgi:hypothetical protein
MSQRRLEYGEDSIYIHAYDPTSWEANKGQLVDLDEHTLQRYEHIQGLWLQMQEELTDLYWQRTG